MGMCFCQTGRYKEHFVCFTCRKMFKKPPFADIPAGRRPATYAEYVSQCPECGQPMHNMGKEFEPPSRRDLGAWREIEHRHREIQRKSMTSPQSGLWHAKHA
jgi:hypothetical protein